MWEMLTVSGSQGEIEETETFESPEQWREWLREHHPRLLDESTWSHESRDSYQQGTDYYWSALTRHPR